MFRTRSDRPLIAAALAMAAALVSAGAAQAQDALARYVVLGADGAATARVITTAPACPDIEINGVSRTMNLRAPAATLAQRPTASKPELSKPSAFPVAVCEAALGRGVRKVSVLGHGLPVLPARVSRIVVIGDTGCRMKAADHAYQACNDPKAYPFAQIAARAAAWKPDLVIHVGDYHYRENPCPDGVEGCAASPWGYGWDAWNADFFQPGAPLLAAAPLVLARGNHEECARAGQGWFRLLDPSPLSAARDCNDPANDVEANDSAPYAVPLGGREQLVVMDMNTAGYKALATDDPRAVQLRRDFDSLRALSAKAGQTMMVTHKPLLGFAAQSRDGEVKLLPGNGAMQSVLTADGQVAAPKGVDILLSGHVHLWQQVSFRTQHPTQFIAGFSGTQEETVPVPETLPDGATPAPGAIVSHFSSWTQGFGYMTLERVGARRWLARIWDVEGRQVNQCRIHGRQSVCAQKHIGA